MKAFTFFNDPYEDEQYPKQIKKIISHLNSIGDININTVLIGDLYREFSEECYFSDWAPLSFWNFNTRYDKMIIEDFAKWLSEKEM